MLAQSRVGRRRSTTPEHITDVAIELFTARGFADVSVDDVAHAAGIARRTLFRYYASKNAILWGDFGTHLAHLQDLLDNVGPQVRMGEALRAALLAFNTFDERETARHRKRMRVILQSIELQDYSMTMYAGWRGVIAGFVARRLGVKTTELVPQTVGWTMLGVALSAYEHWLGDECVTLPEALGNAFDVVGAGLEELGRMTTKPAVEHLVHTLRSQGRFCGSSGSPMYHELFELVAKDVEAGGVFATILAGHEDDSARHAVPLRLLGGLHRLVLDGRAPALRRWYPSTGGTWDGRRAWPEIVAAAANHSSSLHAALIQPPQTNEVGRSAALIGGLLHINREFDFPVRLFEIGSSAGLNLRADHYRYRYAEGQWGPADARVTIDDAWRGAVPPRGLGADHRTAGLRHRAHRRYRRRRGNFLVELRLARPKSAAGSAARRHRCRAEGSRAPRSPAGRRRGGRPRFARRNVDRAVAFDHLAVSVGRRTRGDPRRGRCTGRTSRCAVAVCPSHPRAGHRRGGWAGQVPGACS